MNRLPLADFTEDQTSFDRNDMDTARAWQEFFESWPETFPQQGIIVTTFQETVPFTRFLIAPGLLALERDRPDSIGARKVVLSYNAISAVKMTDTAGLDSIRELGFC